MRLVALLVALLFAFGTLEIGLHVLGAAQPPYERIRCFRPEIYQAWEPFGYRVFPSRTIAYPYPKHGERSRPLTIHSNSYGFRDLREPEALGPGRRILVLGDSFVFGDGVDEADRFTERLEALEPGWRVHNMGMSGFGIDLVLRALTEVGLNAKPDVVLLCVYTNTFVRLRHDWAAVGFRIPRFRLEDGQLVTVPYPKPGLLGRLHTVELVRRVLGRLGNDPAPAIEQPELNEEIFRRFVVLSEQHGFRLAIAFFPARPDLPLVEPDANASRRAWLTGFVERHGVPYLDVTDTLRQEKPSEVHLENDPHWNTRGHALVANALRSFLAGVVAD